MRSICIYCGSNTGRNVAYAAAARDLAEELVARNIRLVYGGAAVGIMGIVADRVLQLGGEVVGVIPDALVQKEIAHSGLTELHVTRSMHERKTMMAELADGFIAMPGGIGTLEELFEVWTWAQLGFHRKPCGLLNVSGYFDALIDFLDHAMAEGFVRKDQCSMLTVAQTPGKVLDRFSSYEPPAVKTWVKQEET